MKTRHLLVLGLLSALSFGCATAPQTRPDRRVLEARADAAMQSMLSQDEGLGPLVARAAGYVVFPQIAAGGAIVGGRSGVGVVYARGGQAIGYAELRGGSFGAQLGGQTYSQLIVFEDDAALRRFTAGNFDLSADATATAITSGTAASAQFEEGTAIFIDDESGLMAGATVGGDSITFRAK